MAVEAPPRQQRNAFQLELGLHASPAASGTYRLPPVTISLSTAAAREHFKSAVCGQRLQSVPAAHVVACDRAAAQQDKARLQERFGQQLAQRNKCKPRGEL